jgi:hypothetical protein
MADMRRQQHDVALVDGHVAGSSLFHHAQGHVAFELIEEFLVRVVVVVRPPVRLAHNHDDEVGIRLDDGIPDRRFEQIAMILDPVAKVECVQRRHDIS